MSRNMKKWLSALFALTMLAVLGLSATPTLANDAISVTVNGQPVVFTDQTPVIIGSRTLVPVRDVFEAMGFDVDWDGRAILERDGDVIIIPIGSSTFTLNGVAHELDVPAQVIAGRTMLPLRHVLESVGYQLDWDGTTRTVIILSGGADAPVATPTPATPTPEPIATPAPTPTPAPAQTGMVNINTASAEELQTLPGIGPVIAERIIQARPFTSIYQLRNVSGIGEVRFNDIKDLVVIE